MRSTVPSAELLVRDPHFHRVKDSTLRTTGLAYFEDRDEDFAARLRKRLVATGLVDCGAYLRLLEQRPEEREAFIAELTIGETYFFRYREQFEALRDVVFPELIRARAAERRLRIWSAGCATGPEPYSVSILLRREFLAALAGWDVTIVGTDINRGFLERARAARYEEWALRSVSPELREACFRREGESWILRPEYQRGVHFQQHNLIDDAFPSPASGLLEFDLILCRNVMIYFNREQIRRLVSCFEQSLLPKGWLVVGHAELNMELYRQWRTVSVPGASLYQKAEPAGPGFPGLSPAPASAVPEGPLLPAPMPELTPPAAWTPPRLPDVPAPLRLPASPPKAPDADSGIPQELRRIRDLADRGLWDAAASAVEALLARHRLEASVHFLRALILDHQGDRAEAEKALRQAIYLDRGHALAHYHLGLLLQRDGHPRLASRAFRNALDLTAARAAEEPVPDGDGMTAGDLAELARSHLEALKPRGA